MTLHAHNYQFLSGQSGAADWTSDWIPVAAAGYRRASFTLAWAAAASTAGVLSFEGTDDPAQGAGNAVPLTISTSHGTALGSVAATASKAMVVLDNCPGYVRVKYVRSGGGAAGQFNGYVTRSD